MKNTVLGINIFNSLRIKCYKIKQFSFSSICFGFDKSIEKCWYRLSDLKGQQRAGWEDIRSQQRLVFERFQNLPFEFPLKIIIRGWKTLWIARFKISDTTVYKCERSCNVFCEIEIGYSSIWHCNELEGDFDVFLWIL